MLGFQLTQITQIYWSKNQMANIKIHELSSLNLSGTELFNDSESFMTELSDENEEMKAILGGVKKSGARFCLIISCWKSQAPQ